MVHTYPLAQTANESPLLDRMRAIGPIEAHTHMPRHQNAAATRGAKKGCGPQNARCCFCYELRQPNLAVFLLVSFSYSQRILFVEETHSLLCGICCTTWSSSAFSIIRTFFLQFSEQSPISKLYTSKTCSTHFLPCPPLWPLQLRRISPPQARMCESER